MLPGGFYWCVNSGESFTNWAQPRIALCQVFEDSSVNTSMKSKKKKQKKKKNTLISYNPNFVAEMVRFFTMLNFFGACGRKIVPRFLHRNLLKSKKFISFDHIAEK